MQNSSAREEGCAGEVRQYDLHGVHIEMRCENRDLRNAVELVFAYFGITPNVDERAIVRGGAPVADLRLVFGSEGPRPRLPEGAEHILTHNSVELWRSGCVLFLFQGPSCIQIRPASGTASGLIATLPWQGHHSATHSTNRGAGLLQLDFVNLVLQTVLVLLVRKGFSPLHAAALGRVEKGDGHEVPSGVLLIAPSNSGKSTQAFGLTRAGWNFLSDDSILLRSAPHSLRQGVIEALPLRREFAIDVEASGNFSEIGGHWRPLLTDEKKQRVDMQAVFPGRSLVRCAPRILLFPEITPSQRSRLEFMRSSEALLALMSQTPLLGACREDASRQLDALRRLLIQAPAFRLRAGRDLKDAPELLSEMLIPLLSQNREMSYSQADRP